MVESLGCCMRGPCPLSPHLLPAQCHLSATLLVLSFTTSFTLCLPSSFPSPYTAVSILLISYRCSDPGLSLRKSSIFHFCSFIHTRSVLYFSVRHAPFFSFSTHCHFWSFIHPLLFRARFPLSPSSIFHFCSFIHTSFVLHTSSFTMLSSFPSPHTAISILSFTYCCSEVSFPSHQSPIFHFSSFIHTTVLSSSSSCAMLPSFPSPHTTISILSNHLP